ncbi:transposase [Pseudomonas sp. PS1(2021)]|uniref:transposase n=1 Tax=Pseudomonas sp. PS1(2021) TaxID=2866282 RepID=UPI0021F32055|nr:transposase [Pseudomonas sp. PS1(2021)]
MTAAVERLKQHGYPVLEEDLARLSPLIYEHINMLGRYSFAVPERSCARRAAATA